MKLRPDAPGVASRRKDQDDAQALIAVAVVVAVGGAGWWKAAREFMLERLPLFIALAAALLALLALVLRRQLRSRRARHACQLQLDAQVGSTDGMSGPAFERLVARLMRRDGFRDGVPRGLPDRRWRRWLGLPITYLMSGAIRVYAPDTLRRRRRRLF